MAVRIRATGEIVCAAMNPEQPGDTYIDDDLHYRLSAERKVLVTTPHEVHSTTGGQWWWKGQIPDDVEIDGFYLNAPPPRTPKEIA